MKIEMRWDEKFVENNFGLTDFFVTEKQEYNEASRHCCVPTGLCNKGACSLAHLKNIRIPQKRARR
jgi:hypothetical protein